MNKRRKSSDLSFGRIASAIFFIALMVGLVLFAVSYDPQSQFSSNFFEDVSNAVQWR
jgi:hypothetical protein